MSLARSGEDKELMRSRTFNRVTIQIPVRSAVEGAEEEADPVNEQGWIRQSILSKQVVVTGHGAAIWNHIHVRPSPPSSSSPTDPARNAGLQPRPRLHDPPHLPPLLPSPIPLRLCRNRRAHLAFHRRSDPCCSLETRAGRGPAGVHRDEELHWVQLEEQG